MSEPIETVPVVQPLPVSVTFTKPETVIGVPPRPIPFAPPVVKGTTRFAGGGAPQGEKRHMLALPVRAMRPPPLPAASNEKFPVPLLALGMNTPVSGKAAGSVTGIVALLTLKIPGLRPVIDVGPKSAEPVPFQGKTIGGSVASSSWSEPLNGKTTAFAEPAASVERLSFRTGEYRTEPTRQTDRYAGGDLSGPDDPVTAAIYYVDDVVIK